MADEVPIDYSEYPMPDEDSRLRFELIVDLLGDHQGVVESASTRVCQLYRDLCSQRSRLDAGNPNSQQDAEDYHWDYDWFSSVIDQVVGAYLVIVQGEVARVTDLVRTHLSRPDTEVRAVGSATVQKQSCVEVIWCLANYFKHRDTWPPSDAELDRRQRPTYEVLNTLADRLFLLAPSPGIIERLAHRAFGCSEEAGLAPILQSVTTWKRGLAEALREGWQ